jgi:hypothetical protein
MIIVPLTQSGLTARVRGVERQRDGSIRAAVDFVRDGEVLFSQRLCLTDAEQRGAVVEHLCRNGDVERQALASDLQSLDTHLADTAEVATPGASSGLNAAREWPESMSAAAFVGLAGNLIEAIEPYTEADPVALLATSLIAFGSAVGSGPHFQVGATRHGVNIFGALVGDTAKARKGDSWSPISVVFRAADPSWTRSSGLVSGEGIIWNVRDPIEKQEPRKVKGVVVDYQTVITDHGVEDKRLMVLESELARTCAAMARAGNTLSPVIRECWDSGDISSLAKNSAAKATGAHISILGHVTESELRKVLLDVECSNGFANRFLWFMVKRAKLLADPQSFAGPALDALVADVRRALHAAQGISKLRRDGAALDLWHQVYPELTEARPGLAGAIVARGEPQTMRLATIYALMDGSPLITPRHLSAALEVWAYAERSATYLWGEQLGDTLADSIDSALRSRGRMTRSEISDMLGRHENGARLDAALVALETAGRAQKSREETGGRPVEYWEPAA